MINELITMIHKLIIILSELIKEFIIFNALLLNINDESDNDESDNTNKDDNYESDNDDDNDDDINYDNESDKDDSDNDESDNDESDNDESDDDESDNDESDDDESDDDESDNDDSCVDDFDDDDSDDDSEAGSYNNIDNETYINKELDNDIIYIDCVNNYIKNKIRYNNYAEFSFIQWNGLHFIKISELQHTINNNHVKNIIKDMEINYNKTNNFIFYDPIHFACDNNNYYIIDGYHRLKAYKILFNKNKYPIQNIPCIIWYTTTEYNKEYIYDKIHERITYYV